MEACNTVERELDKVLLKFSDINEQAGAVLTDLVNHIETLKKELEEGKKIYSFIYQSRKHGQRLSCIYKTLYGAFPSSHLCLHVS